MKYGALSLAILFLVLTVVSPLAWGIADFSGSLWGVSKDGIYAFGWLVGIINVPSWCVTAFLWEKDDA